MRLFKYSFILIIFFLSCDAKNEKLKVGTNVWPGYEAIYIARENGLLDKNIKLIEFSSASQVLRAYRRNLINGAGLTLDEVIFLKSLGFSPKIILIADVSEGADVLIVKPYIKTLKDLKGKRIGVENTALGAFFLSRILEIAGLSEKDVKIVPAEVNEHFEIFVKNKVDAVITFEPVKSRLLRIGGKVLFDSSQIPNEIVDVFIVEEYFSQSYPQIVQKFVNAYFFGLKLLKSKDTKALKAVAEREKVSLQEVINSYEGLKLPDVNENLIIFKNKLKDTILKITQILKKKGLIRKDFEIKPEELIEIKFLENLKNGRLN